MALLMKIPQFKKKSKTDRKKQLKPFDQRAEKFRHS